MSEQEKSIFGTGGFIDLGSSGLPDGFDPFGDTTEEPANNVTQLPQSSIQLADADQPPKSDALPVNEPESDETDTDGDGNNGDNPLAQAIEAAENKEVSAVKDSLFSRAPQFSYGNVTEDIADTSKTFEDLRLDKLVDFPEFEDGKNVSWSVEYGKITKQVSDPKGTSVGKMKTQIETSKEFVESLKKIKVADRENVTCKIKPRITAQKKGELPAYKGIFNSIEAAEASGKVICIVPARDGKVYEMRNTEIGTFITPANNVVELSEVAAGFFPALPRVPIDLLRQIVGFFRSFIGKEEQYEALVHVLWDKEHAEYCVNVPHQTVTRMAVNAHLKAEYPSQYIHVMDIHSHNNMPAKFSSIDDDDEKATRIYAVIGKLERYWPDISVRISNGGKYLNIAPELIFDDTHESFPYGWTQKVALPTETPNYANWLGERFDKGGGL